LGIEPNIVRVRGELTELFAETTPKKNLYRMRFGLFAPNASAFWFAVSIQNEGY
jgi:hypothetical protein